MQRLARRIVPRLLVLAGLGSLALVVHGLTLLQPAPWTAPSVTATAEGFLVAWLDGSDDRVPLQVLSLGRDLSPRGSVHTLARASSAARIVLDHEPGRGTRVRLVGDPAQPPWRVIGVVDELGRPGRRPAAVRDWPSELRPSPPVIDAWPGKRCRSLPPGAPVRDVTGQTRARISFAPGGWATLSAVPGGPALADDRVGPASCHALSSGPCLAAAADGDGVVVAWTRNRALGSELVVTRLPPQGRGARVERVLRAAPSFALALAFAGFVGLVMGLAGHAVSRSLESSRVLWALRRRWGRAWLEGRVDDPTDLIVSGDARGYRVRTRAAWLELDGGQRLALRPGQPVVVTAAALDGELPALAAVVATFERVWAAGRAAHGPAHGPYRGGGGRALEVDVLSDRPLPFVRAAMRSRLGWSILDAVALAGVVAAAFAAAL